MSFNLKSFKIDRMIFAIGALVIGVILLVWPSTSLIVMGKCIGAFLAGGGLVAAFMFLRDHDSALKSVLLIMAAVMLICGIVIFLHPDDLVRLIPTIMGILVLCSGLINLGETFILTRSKYSKWWISLLVAIATIAAGIFLIRNAFSLASLITRIAGGVLIFDGLSDLWVVSRISRTVKDSKADASAVDAQAVVVNEPAAQSRPEAGPAPAANAESAPATGAESASAVNAESAPAAGAENAPVTDRDAVPGANSDSRTPDYIHQPEQDTDYAAFAGADPAQKTEENDKKAE